MNFSVRGKFEGESLVIAWEEGRFSLLKGKDSSFQKLLVELEETAAIFADVNFTATTIATDIQPPHMACPYRLLHLLIYKTIVGPPLMDHGDLIEIDFEEGVPEGAKV